MQACATWLLMAVLFAVCGECADSVALMFSREITLRGVGDVRVNSSFDGAAATYIDRAIKPNLFLIHSFAVPPDVVIVVGAWLLGSPEEVDTSMQKLNATFNGWSTAPDASLVANLNQLSLMELGTQPAGIEFKDNCSYGGESIDVKAPGFGFDNLTIFFTMRVNPRENLVQSLCQILSIPDCSLIALNSVSELGSVYVAQVTVTSSNRNLLFIQLMNHLRYASALFSEHITAMTVGGVQVYATPKLPALTYKGDTDTCLSRYWYLIFLILLLPLALIAGQRFRYMGAKSGVKSVRAMEWDIRSGVRYQGRMQAEMGGRGQLPQAAFFGGFPPGMHYGAYAPHDATWQNTQLQRQMSQQGPNVHYDPHALWQYTGEDNRHRYPSVRRS
ncbi:uncharacterized protein Tco025E_09386 [Trypanosoma conorhini]|uniref:Uncharacterized protein n=1 Tax=Trypanosoma conorhini TaxID=83891 RepID=A0A422MWR9_9TRYP|nr:uncharacterized protein Tco025E_09386 [Trypanosoma conorhini]RNE97668.1 hypothetical protein Tco025E_09386 [Trypanosoma conorhini]